MIQKLEQALHTVPFLSTLGITVEQARPGEIVLRLPSLEGNTSHGGSLHTGAIFAVGELAAGVALGTHPELAELVHLIRGTRIKYVSTSFKDVTAHATVNAEVVSAILERTGEGKRAEVDIPVKIMDGHGTDVADLQVRYAFKS